MNIQNRCNRFNMEELTNLIVKPGFVWKCSVTVQRVSTYLVFVLLYKS